MYYAVEHISLILAAPNWLPVRFRTDIKVLPGLGASLILNSFYSPLILVYWSFMAAPAVKI